MMSEFVEIRVVTEGSENEIVHRIPENGSLPIKMGAQLIVRENQRAVFFRDGKSLDVFGPGRHTLSTANLPLVTKALSLPFGFQSPFRAEVYFINSKIFTNMKWGTKTPISLRDSDLGLVNIRAFGVYSFKVRQPLLFINTLVGTRALYSASLIEDYFREIIVTRFTDLMGETLKSVFDLPRDFDEISAIAGAKVENDFKKYGIEIRDFAVSNISMPEEVQQMVDERSGMNIVGDMDSYMKFKASRAMGDAAEGNGSQGGSDASAGMGLGIGAGLGMLLPGMMNGQSREKKSMMKCRNCGSMVSEDAKFCPQCGEPVMDKKNFACPSCGKPVEEGSKFCPSCGSKIEEKRCPECGEKIDKHARFCPKCGKEI